MVAPEKLSKREQQIMEVVFAQGSATVNDVVAQIESAPTPMAVRRMMHILVEKGYLRSRKQGREAVYFPCQKKHRAGSKALEQVLKTFFGGSLSTALSVHFSHSKETLNEQEKQTLIDLIEKARKEGR